MTNRLLSVRRGLAVASAAAVLAIAASCHGAVTDALLVANDPDIINPENVNTADGATALRLGALGRLRGITAGGESTWLFGGLLADEWTTSSTFIQNDEADERSFKSPPDNSSIQGQYRSINQVRTSANQAIAAMKIFLPAQSANIGELYMARGVAELTLAQNFCNGTPLSDGSGATLIYGAPITNDAMFRVAIASFDSATSVASGTDALSVSVFRAAKIGKARAQLGINDYAGAAASVAGIPTSYTYDITFSLTGGTNTLWGQPFSSRRYNVGDTIVTTSAGKFSVKPSLPFGSAGDPRLPVSNSPAGTKSQDGSVISYTTPLYDQLTSTSLFNGIDARLIEAENQLKLGDVTGWLNTLNTLRRAPPKLGTVQPAVMADLADPGTTATRVDLLFREKAFWTFSRGQRLSDMRRLVRQYGRAENTIYPTGTHYRGVPYGDWLSLPVTNQEDNNPNFKGCLDKKA
ncbi:MAG TPA: hypothetical protein VJL28_07955 [Gemmatimonadaceae bacterium]|nr:hypothetical protein [Gemmatimonadaceae bacterium]